MTRGLIIAAPASGSGKTLVTLGLLRHLRQAGIVVASAKVGPDYIDGAFHRAASGRPCFNLDTWAMRPATLRAIVDRAGEGADLVLAEGVMGLFDGAPVDGGGPDGSTADLAAATGWPVLLVVDARGMGASAAALVQGYAGFRAGVEVAGVLFNRIGGPGHGEILRRACRPLGIPVLGALPRRAELALPDRHLGLVQAGEHGDLETVLDRAAAWIGDAVDIDALLALARAVSVRGERGVGSEAPALAALPPLGQRIAVARDTAFAFAYPHLLDGWRANGAEILPFSPLADEAPDAGADAVFLPGGYPELHAGRLAAAGRFKAGVRGLADQGAVVYGECGGYMVLGRGLVDAEGERHEMLGLLPPETSFAAPRMTLGYRQASLVADGPLGSKGAGFRGHEFHFARLLGDEGAAPLFACRDARDRDLGPAGCRDGTVMGAFVHLVDRAG